MSTPWLSRAERTEEMDEKIKLARRYLHTVYSFIFKGSMPIVMNLETIKFS